LNENFTYKFSENEETDIILWGDSYKVRRNDTDLDGTYEALDIDTNADGVYEIIEGTENLEFSMLNINDGLNYGFVIENIDPDGRFFTFNFNKSESVPYKFEQIESHPVRPDKPPADENNYIIIETDTNKAGMIVNGSDTTVWRSVWLSDETTGNDINALLKASVIWASDKTWWNVMRSVSDVHTKMHYFVSQGEEFHEPYWVEFSVWNIY